MTTNLIEAAERALYTLEQLACLGNGNSYGNSIGNVMAQKAIPDLTAAIEAAKSVEPVGCFYIDHDGSWRQAHDPEFLHIHTPLYLAPPAQPEAQT